MLSRLDQHNVLEQIYETYNVTYNHATLLMFYTFSCSANANNLDYFNQLPPANGLLVFDFGQLVSMSSRVGNPKFSPNAKESFFTNVKNRNTFVMHKDKGI